MPERPTYIAPIDANQRRAWLAREVPLAIERASGRVVDDIAAMAIIDTVLERVEAGLPLASAPQRPAPPRYRAADRLDVLRRAARELGISLEELRKTVARLPSHVLTGADHPGLDTLALERLDKQVAGLKSRPVRRAPGKGLSGSVERYIPKADRPQTRFISTALIEAEPDDLPENVEAFSSRRRIQAGGFWLYPPKRSATVLDIAAYRVDPGRAYRAKDGKVFIRNRPDDVPNGRRRRDDDDDGIDPLAKARVAERRARWEERRLERMRKNEKEQADA